MNVGKTRMSASTALIAAALGLVATGALAGCSAGTPAPAASVGAQAQPLLSAITYSSKMDALISRASERLIGKCMKKAGFSYQEVTALEIEETPYTLYALGFVTLKEVNARQLEPAVDPSDERVTAAYDKALNGDRSKYVSVVGPDGTTSSRPVNGCAAEADKSLVGDDVTLNQFLSTKLALLDGIAQSQVSAATDPALVKGIESWSSCMKDKGHDFATPEDVVAARAVKQRLATWKPAVDDMACKKTANLFAIGAQAWGTAQQKYADEHPGVITSWKSTLDKKYQAAREVLAQK